MVGRSKDELKHFIILIQFILRKLKIQTSNDQIGQTNVKVVNALIFVTDIPISRNQVVRFVWIS